MEGGGKAAVFGTKTSKEEGKCDLSRCSMTQTKKKLPQYIFNRLQFLLFFCIQFLDSWNLIMDKFYNRQNNKSYCFFFGVILAKALFFKFVSRTVRFI
jgi:hypothetical protein